MGKIKFYKFKYYENYCCDLCDSDFNVQFNCPICKEKRVKTSMLYDLDETLKGRREFSCEKCKSRFKIIKKFIGYKIQLLR